MRNQIPQDKLRAAPAEDPLIACIQFVATHFGQNFQRTALSALARDESGRLPFHQAEAALDLAFINNETLWSRQIRKLARKLPAILRTRDGGCAVLLEHRADQYLFWRPGDGDPVWTGEKTVEEIYAGEAIGVAADPTSVRADERPWDEMAKRHWFWGEVYRMRRSFYPVLGAALMINLLGFALPLFTMNVYDRVMPNKAVASLWVLAIGALLAFAVEFALRLARATLLDDLGRELDIKLSEKIFSKMLNIPLADRRGSTGMLARRVSEFETVRDFFASTTIVLVVDLAFLFLFIAMIAIFAGWLAIVPLAIISAMIVAGFFLQRRMTVAALENQADASIQHSMLVESIGGAETVKSCAAEGQMLGRWHQMVDASARTQSKLRRSSAAAINLASLGQQFSSLSLIIGGFYLFDAGKISMGAIIAIVMLAGRSMSPVSQLAFLITRGRQAWTTMASIQQMIESDDERRMGSSSLDIAIGRGQVTLDDMSFTYPGAAVPSLSDINLKIEPGERIAIVGRVASGKSTLGRLICGLYAPTRGSLYVDGLDSRQYSPIHLRSQLRFVGQDSVLFSGSIKQNLKMCGTSTSDAELLRTLQAIGADRFLSRDGGGLDRVTGERGSLLSGGQRSFLAIARALASPSRLLFLDEPTGAMDTQSERFFLSALTTRLDRSQTVVIATHREAVLQLCDRIIVIDGGKIVADGPREKILTQAKPGEVTP
ncbi:type I secretion system permease/ATPase [Sphingopyxis indica]|uniref:ATP-binding cassette, subfamily C, LapB n=1 Tax=Sphingopyxis indica TaxID=436663 RepID=A0A239K2D9_9SPHN|nr:type I secretion system permease/ATPase [Sphingopyxis indica]SNT12547.1 ATP-binding cassette, subfamily C, LapB [Sphingopyxis indica]